MRILWIVNSEFKHNGGHNNGIVKIMVTIMVMIIFHKKKWDQLNNSNNNKYQTSFKTPAYYIDKKKRVNS